MNDWLKITLRSSHSVQEICSSSASCDQPTGVGRIPTNDRTLFPPEWEIPEREGEVGGIKQGLARVRGFQLYWLCAFVRSLHPQQHYNLLMHGVVKDSSTSTKLHIVFDASARTTRGISLNDILLPGPSLYPSLYHWLLHQDTQQYQFLWSLQIPEWHPWRQ